MNYDIIGDVHGKYDKLIQLLKKLGYSPSNGIWYKENHQAIFVGDLVDRGPQQIETISLVRHMVEKGYARCIMGNHEFNAIAWATDDPDQSGQYLRSHTEHGNREQHSAFLAEVEGEDVHHELIEWFKTLPLWLELDGIRVVHACWNSAYMAQLKEDPDLDKEKRIGGDLWIRSNREKDPAFYAVEAICKGLEVDLPPGYGFTDGGGKVRTKMRIRWWENCFSTYQEAALVPSHIRERIPDLQMREDKRIVPYEGVPVFFGHYGLSGTPKLLAPNIACVDFSSSETGFLTAYQWGGENILKESRFLYV